MKNLLQSKDLEYLANINTSAIEEIRAEDYIKKIENIIKAIFPNSFIKISINKWERSGSIFIHFALGKDKNEWNQGIIDNDPLHTKLRLYGSIDSNTNNMKDKIKLEMVLGDSIILKEKDETGYRSKKVKIGFRTSIGTPEKILKSIQNYFIKAKNILKEYKDKIKDFELIKI
jgi:hypothetical protein